MNDKNEQTVVSQEDIDIEHLMDSNEVTDTKGFLDDLKPVDSDMSNFFNEEPAKKEEKEEKQEPENKETESELEKTVNQSTEKTEPSGKNGVIKSLIDKGVLLGFNDETPVEDYTDDDIKELIETNINEIKKNANEEFAQEFFENLPPEIQAAYQYVQKGGTDIKGMLRALSVSKEISDYDISGQNGQRGIIKAYLMSTNYGTEDEIEDEINSIADRGELEKKANQFKPKLEAMQQNIIRNRIAAQQKEDERRQEVFKHYEEGVYNALNKEDLNGLHLTKKTKNMLYNGLVRPDFQTSSGRQTNQLFHLIEKYQFVEPRQDLLAETLWLLSDPEGYRSAVSQSAVMKNNEETARKLKTVEQSKELNNTNRQQSQRTVSRPMKRGIFD